MLEHPQSPAPAERRPVRHALRLLFVVAGLTAITAIAWLFWNRAAETRLQQTIDHYRSLGQPVLIEDFQSNPVPDEENAAILLLAAASALEQLLPKNVPHDWFSDPENFLECDEAGPVLESFAPSVTTALKGLERPHTDFGLQIQKPVLTVAIPHLSPMRTLVKFLTAAARIEVLQGDEATALQLINAGVQIGDRLQRRPGFIISVLVGAACRALSAQTLEDVLPHLTLREPAAREAARGLIERLLDEAGRSGDNLDNIDGERLIIVDSTLWLRDGVSAFAVLTGRVRDPGTGLLLLIGRPVLTLDAVHQLHLMSATRESFAADEYTCAKSIFPTQPASGGLDDITHFSTNLLLPSLGRTLELSFQDRLKTRLAGLALAIRLFEAEQQEELVDLQQLIPTYLQQIPCDPFDPKAGRLSYRSDGSLPRLYSFGIDTVDNDGVLPPEPYQRKENWPDWLFFLETPPECLR